MKIDYRQKFKLNDRNLTVPEWSAQTGIPQNTIRKRIRSGMTIDLALKPFRSNGVQTVGRVYGRLTVLKDFSYSGIRYLECRCSCGTVVTVKKTNVLFGTTKSCGCVRVEHMFKVGSKNLAVGEASFNALFRSYQRGAFRRKLAFELSLGLFRELTSLPCVYCGSPPNQSLQKQNSRGSYTYSGIDRVDNGTGYTQENSVPCCKTCNMVKRHLTVEEFYGWIQKVSSHLSKTNYELPVGIPVKNPSLLPDKSILPARITANASRCVT